MIVAVQALFWHGADLASGVGHELHQLHQPMCPRQAWESATERRYKKMMSSIQLTKDFYFSYDYPLWRTLQSNMTDRKASSAFDSMFVWNEYLTR